MVVDGTGRMGSSKLEPFRELAPFQALERRSMGNGHSGEKEVVARVRTRFPEEASRTDAWLVERGWEDLEEAPHTWVEAFADRTTEAARARNWNSVKEHTEFMAAEYRNGPEAIRVLVDVAYAENWMWNLGSSVRVLAWPSVAKEVRELYEQMWGPPGNAGG